VARLNPAPLGPLPIMIAAFGEQVMLRLVAEHADMWNVAGPPEDVARKAHVLNEWCEKVGRDPGEIERTVLLFPDSANRWGEYADLGFQHLIVPILTPFDLDPAKRLLDEVRQA
jgi:alkanesulfonate monooxygenase SsuD/methylene tetrahydromethanopterin reductase-like flavin-dependent oxidoreductase (luciferase family)